MVLLLFKASLALCLAHLSAFGSVVAFITYRYSKVCNIFSTYLRIREKYRILFMNIGECLSKCGMTKRDFARGVLGIADSNLHEIIAGTRLSNSKNRPKDSRADQW